MKEFTEFKVREKRREAWVTVLTTPERGLFIGHIHIDDSECLFLVCFVFTSSVKTYFINSISAQ